MKPLFPDRQEAGRLLAIKLTFYAQRPNVLVLGLPRGGVPVAFEVAQALHLPLDICLVRKLGVPGREELAMGAIATGGIKVINENTLDFFNITSEIIDRVADQELQELQRREQVYRGDRPYPVIKDQTIILVDDGIATGSTVLAAITALKVQHPAAIIIATPVVSPQVSSKLETEVEKLICLIKPKSLHSISLWYEDFAQITDEQVCYFLAQN